MHKQREWSRMRWLIYIFTLPLLVKSCLSHLPHIFSFESDCCLSGWGPGGIPYNLGGVEVAGSLGNHKTAVSLCLWVVLDIFPHYSSSDPGELTSHLLGPTSWLQESMSLCQRGQKCVANEGHASPFTLVQCQRPFLLGSKVEWSRVQVPTTVSALFYVHPRNIGVVVLEMHS